MRLFPVPVPTIPPGPKLAAVPTDVPETVPVALNAPVTASPVVVRFIRSVSVIGLPAVPLGAVKNLKPPSWKLITDALSLTW